MTVVKIQVSLETNLPKPSCLVYDRHRKIHYQDWNSDFHALMKEKLGDRPKGYFDVEFDKEGDIIRESMKEVPAEPW